MEKCLNCKSTRLVYYKYKVHCEACGFDLKTKQEKRELRHGLTY